MLVDHASSYSFLLLIVIYHDLFASISAMLDSNDM